MDCFLAGHLLQSNEAPAREASCGHRYRSFARHHAVEEPGSDELHHGALAV